MKSNLQRFGIALTAAVGMFIWTLPAAGSAAEVVEWSPVYRNAGVQVDARETASGFDRHRGSVVLCSTIDEVASFATDVAGYPQWVAFTLESRSLEHTDERTVFYLKSSSPWPMRPRDMIYELVADPVDGGVMRVVMTGLPEALPPEPGAVRMRSVEGEWLFITDGAELEVQLTLHVVPGRVPRVFANRRFARMVGDTLAAMAERFPCVTRFNDVVELP
jgi:hypothetical protein